MPEIKNQFTGGKMNKDLSERLISNGEYRDAMNIQVSTSEGSDVGSAQNILGNSLVSNQNFIGPHATCVGSIADEKNDKLYYFIIATPIHNDGFRASSDAAWTYSNEVAEYDGTAYSWVDIDLGGFVHVGSTYKISFTNTTDSGNPLVVQLGGVNSEPITTTGSQTIYITAGSNYTAGNTENSIRFYAGSSGTRWNGTISNVVVTEQSSRIIEYDSKTNSITPVLVDIIGDVLKFDSQNIITGINIIDGLLFWTDNVSEPKKINIQQSIDGTDASGKIHSNFYNYDDPDVSVPIKEEHITVIKKGPKNALGLGFLDPLDREGKVLAGIIKTTDGNSPSDIRKNHTRSTHPSDFGGIFKNDIVRFDVPVEAVNSTSNFILDWKVGDYVVFKEFEDGIAPALPLSTFTAKGIIQDWQYNRFTDSDPNVIKNGQFTTFNSPTSVDDWSFNFASGSYPEQTNQMLFGWRSESQQGGFMVFQTTGVPGNSMAWAKLWQSPINHNFTVGDSYTLNFTVGDIPQGGFYGANVRPMRGRIKGRIVINGDRYNFPYVDTPGTYSQTIEIGPDTFVGSSSGYWNNHFYFETDGNQECRGALDNVTLEHVEATNARVSVKIINIDNNPPTPSSIGNQTELNYVIDKYVEPGSLFKDKFVRFSHRYKYIDGEHSTFAPFTGVAFSSGAFDYNPKNGYNLGMVNKLLTVELQGFVTSDMPEGIVAIDLLAKVEDSPIIYLVDTIRQTDPVPLSESANAWNSNKYSITSDTVKGAIPSNQLLRPWDNVPKQALSQEITGNRLVYGNYKQGYNLINSSSGVFSPEFDVGIVDGDIDTPSRRSIKSERDYQIGVVFLDEYGRETPVLSNQTGSFNVPRDLADKSNVLEVTFKNNSYPVHAKYFKFFMKENSSEYYNVAMGRHYLDNDGAAWLSFPSSDRNKIDEETTLTLKKGVSSSSLVVESNEYKVLAIKNEAPDFVRTSRLLIEEKRHNAANTSTDLFDVDLVDAPISGVSSFKVNYEPFQNSSGSALDEITDGELYVQFSIDGVDKVSKQYKVSNLSLDAAKASYSFQLQKVLDDDVDFITDDVSGFNSTKIKENVTLSIYKYIKDDADTFEGRFYVKITADSIFKDKVKITSEEEKNYEVINSKKLYFMRSDFAENQNTGEGHHNAMTGLDGVGGVGGSYKTVDNPAALYNGSGLSYVNYQMQNSATNQWAWSGGANFTTLTSLADSHKDFSKFAVFFRNYKYKDSSETLEVNDGQQTMMDVGRWKFGSTPGAWKAEFLSYTSIGALSNPNNPNVGVGGFVGAWSNVAGIGVMGNYADQPTATQVADERQPEDEVMFIDQGPWLTSRGSNNSLHWGYMSALGLNATKTAFAANAKSRQYRSGIIEGNTSWTMDIGQGPIFKTGLGNTNADFFGNNNPEYQLENDKDLVAKQNPGSQFRFREDPTETVYTLIPSTGYKRLVRYAANYNYGGSKVLNQREIPQLSVNFTNNRTVRCTPAIEWNPVEDHDLKPISSGYNFSIAATSGGINTTGGNIDEHYIRLGTDIGVDPVYGNIPVVPGLIITKHGTTQLGGPNTPYLIVKDVVESGGEYRVYLCGYSKMLHEDHTIKTLSSGDAVVFQQPTMNGYSENSVNRFNQHNPTFSLSKPGIRAVGYTVEFLDENRGEQSMPDNPAIFETEPKTSGDGDIYYEASGAKAVVLDESTIETVLPLGSIITSDLNDPGVYNANAGPDSYIPENTSITEYVSGNRVMLSNDVPVEDSNVTVFPNVIVAGVYPGKNYRVISPNGNVSYVTIESIIQDNTEAAANTTRELVFEKSIINKTHFLTWHNCYSFGNGVESNRIKDSFNESFISNGVKASATLQEDLGEEHRKFGLIFSGIYNSNSSVNNLNQFIQAEKITKDLNPVYGSIQKLHTRDSDLIALCEDKVLRILANKDAIFNADGNPQLTANENVLGQAIPFSGEYGISKNPESFASENYRIYFTDKQRGAVMRLSKDGLTAISDAGMKDYFKDSLKTTTKIVGSHDDKKSEYNLTLVDRKVVGEELIVNGELTLEVPALIEIPYAAGQWVMSSGPHWFWSDTNKNLYSDASPHSRVGQYLPPISSGKTYEVSWTVGERDNQPLQGYLWVTLHDNRYDATTLRSNYKSISLKRTKVGKQTATVTVDNSWNPWVWADGTDGALGSSLQFHNKEHTHNDGLYFNGTIDNVSVREIITQPATVSFREDVRGWVSFKSFISESGISCAGDYYTVKHGKLWKHHAEGSYENRNTFYGNFINSSLTSIANQEPAIVKSFHALSYDGSQAKVNQNLEDDQYYNMKEKDGWFVSSIKTDKQEGTLSEFIEKEGKWFNHVKGVNSDLAEDLDMEAFNVQGIGALEGLNIPGAPLNSIAFASNINTSLQIGDTIYYQQINVGSSKIIKYGIVENIGIKVVTIDKTANPNVADPSVGDFVLFEKNKIANTSSILGYYASVKFENNSKDKAEIFAVSSEVTQSSK